MTSAQDVVRLEDGPPVDWNAGCSCGWRGASEDAEDHPCTLPDPMELMECCSHTREWHFGDQDHCELCDCHDGCELCGLRSRPASAHRPAS
jgi:hypothetical protein